MEMQRTLGKTEQSLSDIKSGLADNTRKVGRIEKVIYAAGVVLAIVVITGGWLLNSAKDFLMLQYRHSLEQQAKPTPPPPPQGR
jgi:cell division protein FtsL